MPRGYKDVGVLSNEEMGSFGSAIAVLRETFAYPRRGKPVTRFGLYAAVLDLGNNLGLAISTDGVGTKLLVAEEMRKFDTVGIDCVAMNVNDIVCVGAEPISMVDYIAVASAEGDQLAQIAIGLREGARQAHISIPGGETAQIPELLHTSLHNEAFDLAGTCVGNVAMDRIIDGTRVEPGDALLGFSSSGIHSNGLTLARRTLQQYGALDAHAYVPEFGRTLGEELLEPTTIYVDLALALMAACDVRAMAHITSDGLLNLRRLVAQVGFEIDYLPDPQPIFQLVQGAGELEAAEMYRVFNMGTGFCAVVPEADADAAMQAAGRVGLRSWRLGRAVASDERAIRLLPLGLTSDGDQFVAG
ncbi:hypothetical protein AYO38_09740 [bacterium SCGC AG-212-C10]|nr:hypothetical protein AYO38_09740 [bacterium SCGC AG-212-C10]